MGSVCFRIKNYIISRVRVLILVSNSTLHGMPRTVSDDYHDCDKQQLHLISLWCAMPFHGEISIPTIERKDFHTRWLVPTMQSGKQQRERDFNQLVSWPKEINCPIPEWVSVHCRKHMGALRGRKEHPNDVMSKTSSPPLEWQAQAQTDLDVFFAIFATIPTLELWLLLCKLHSFTFIPWEVYKFPLSASTPLGKNASHVFQVVIEEVCPNINSL